MTRTQHVDDHLDEWLDDRLSPAERAAVDSHLRECDECRGLRDALLATRQVLREADAPTVAPEGLEARIRRALDLEDRARARKATESAPSPSRSGAWLAGWGRRGWVLAAAAVLVVAVGLALWVTPSAPALLDDAFAQYTVHEDSGALSTLAVASADDLVRRWRRAELGFEARVLDLGAMGLEIAGADTPRLGNHRAALAVYTSASRPLVACWMFRGAEAELPPAVEEHRERGFHFRIYDRDGVTLVVWREGEVLCALASRGPRHEVLALAIAKAMAPPAALDGT